jgi:methylase of polypeptide subunit release factors
MILCDVGTGSGCIGQSIFLSQNPKNIEHLYSFDISSEAIEVARINAQKHSIIGNVTFFPEGFETFDRHFQEEIFSENIDTYIITANLPYIRSIDF